MGTQCSRVILAGSEPCWHRAVLDQLEHGAADVVRIPQLHRVFSPTTVWRLALHGAIADTIMRCVRLHDLRELIVIGYSPTEGILPVLDHALGGAYDRPKLTYVQAPADSNQNEPRGLISAIVCGDFRDTFSAYRTMLMRENPREGMLCLPGGVKMLVEPGLLQAFILGELAEGEQAVTVIQHEDCGAYGPELAEDKLGERLRHYGDMDRFFQIAAQYGVAVLEAYMLHLNQSVTTL